jgi:LemA protein
VQLEGTENRIAAARADYIETVQGYNASLRRFPNNLFASFFGFEPAAHPEVDQADMERPDVEFDFGR